MLKRGYVQWVLLKLNKLNCLIYYLITIFIVAVVHASMIYLAGILSIMKQNQKVKILYLSRGCDDGDGGGGVYRMHTGGRRQLSYPVWVWARWQEEERWLVSLLYFCNTTCFHTEQWTVTVSKACRFSILWLECHSHSKYQVVQPLTVTFCFTSHVKRICSIELSCVFLQEDVSPRCTNLLPMDLLTLASRSDREKAKVWPRALQTKLI